MDEEAGGAGPVRAFAAVALALAGFAFSFTPLAERLDGAALDREWQFLRAVAPRAAPDDIVIVGIDDASLKTIPEPPGAWHAPLGEVLVRIASAHPRAIALDVTLPDRSFEALHPGLDRALLVGLAAARDNGPFVAVLAVDADTRAARTVFPPYLAVLGEQRLALDLQAREADGVTRRFALTVPTQDGGFPTLVGRLCGMLSPRCEDGLIHFALGEPLRYVSFARVREMRDAAAVQAQFRDRIVLVGATARHVDRIAVPWNPAGWEDSTHDAPNIAVHAQALRTALAGAAPRQGSRPLAILLVTLAAVVAVAGGRRWIAVAALLGGVALPLLATSLLRGGLFVPIAAPLATLFTGLGLRVVARVSQGRRKRGTPRRA